MSNLLLCMMFVGAACSNCAHTTTNKGRDCRVEPDEIYQTPKLNCETGENNVRICAYGHTMTLGDGPVACVFTLARKNCEAEWDLLTGNCTPVGEKENSLR